MDEAHVEDRKSRPKPQKTTKPAKNIFAFLLEKSLRIGKARSVLFQIETDTAYSRWCSGFCGAGGSLCSRRHKQNARDGRVSGLVF
ncbi:hypothetical protein QO002_002201 [Pararhizobium capsulatum DSM 1112]|uniref:Transposase n=1 Tax=Pararhizobium capsulatum DSM 1112 TaxID=1121113 RepID=A0ABU0BQ48_9HYPH|nr:hypothetical protein [Pararhizobium capsulatum]MDQ0320063.1 hypothetical protein [Pararhizobium capsulatum DSM 1112]